MNTSTQNIKSYLSGRILKFENHMQLGSLLRILREQKVITDADEEWFMRQMAAVDKNYIDICGAAVMTDKHFDFPNKTVTTYETAILFLSKWA